MANRFSVLLMLLIVHSGIQLQQAVQTFAAHFKIYAARCFETAAIQLILVSQKIYLQDFENADICDCPFGIE